MGFRGYRTAAKPEEINRPALVALGAVAGILASLALFALTVTLLYLRTSRGLSLTDQLLDMGVTVVAALFLLWIYWGTWDMLPSAWWTHMTLGPVLVIGMLLLIGFAPEAAKIVAHDMLRSEIAQAEMVIRFAAIGLAVIEGVTILAVLGSRKAFKIGEKKPLWERAKY